MSAIEWEKHTTSVNIRPTQLERKCLCVLWCDGFKYEYISLVCSCLRNVLNVETRRKRNKLIKNRIRCSRLKCMF